jgi:hypothetical protein
LKCPAACIKYQLSGKKPKDYYSSSITVWGNFFINKSICRLVAIFELIKAKESRHQVCPIAYKRRKGWLGLLFTPTPSVGRLLEYICIFFCKL